MVTTRAFSASVVDGLQLVVTTEERRDRQGRELLRERAVRRQCWELVVEDVVLDAAPAPARARARARRPGGADAAGSGATPRCHGRQHAARAAAAAWARSRKVSSTSERLDQLETGVGPAGGELGFGERLDRLAAQLVEPHRGRLHRRMVGGVGERAPRPTTTARRAAARRRPPRRFGHHVFEPPRVDLAAARGRAGSCRHRRRARRNGRRAHAAPASAASATPPLDVPGVPRPRAHRPGRRCSPGRPPAAASTARIRRCRAEGIDRGSPWSSSRVVPRTRSTRQGSRSGTDHDVSPREMRTTVS